jgi:hypothetical protein
LYLPEAVFANSTWPLLRMMASNIVCALFISSPAR